MRRNCPSPWLSLERVTPALPQPSEIQPASTVLRVKRSGPEMCIHLLIYDMEVCALLDSGARRSVLPRLCYETIKADWEICLVYLDDIIVLGKDVKEMLQRLAQVFEKLRQANLKVKPAKCCLFCHIVSAHGIATDPEKVQKI
ncbi:Retrovirus-related Pol poly from transposon [Labeo rohita]|uniref:ribonuclease H n=1 Tax=Labeo rohita TaxID=84645 RepID=A0A498NFP4_LABRO|nr:Retrovirus-related Pol poly from transposon [Labeo rohita]RXN30507.1 Retrovirus-related Pol poly from transposon [Labeo rohita]